MPAKQGAASKPGRIRVGIGGWTFEPWRGTFYPKGLPHAKELTYASEHLTSIEVNGTFYRTQTPATFAKWASETPDDFVFSIKGPRYVVQRGVLAEGGDSLKRFFDSGLTEPGPKLGPILWQLAPTKKFNAPDIEAFLGLLPRELGDRRVRHVLEVRHASFCVPEFIALLRKFEVPVVFAEHETYPAIADVTGDFLYGRLQRGQEELKSGYPAKALDEWAKRAKAWASGGAPADLTVVDAKAKPKAKPRDVFLYFIHEAKVRAPAAAMSLIERLGK